MSKKDKEIKENKIKIVSGDGSNLIISPAYDSVNNFKSKQIGKKPKNIVIPKSDNK